jgi:2-iminobutanoate/2-iminopropanoate deaminase
MADKHVVSTSNAPQNDRPYSQANVANGFCFVSGQGPTDPETMEGVTGDIREQTRQTLDNLQAIIEEAGGTLEDVVKVTVYLDDIDTYDALNEAYGEYFDSNPPSRVCIEAARLPGDIDVEIEAIAYLDSE